MPKIRPTSTAEELTLAVRGPVEGFLLRTLRPPEVAEEADSR